MTVSSHDVAREFRERIPGVGVVKLHKLLYYAQGWHLALTGQPVFDERIEAWANGPVVPELWADEKHGRELPDPHRIEGSHLAAVHYVVERYGQFTGRDLIRLTHNEDPWRDVSESEDPFVLGSPEIPLDALRVWFEQDDELVERASAVERLRERVDVHSFGPLTRDPDLTAAVDRAERGERVRHGRPR